MGNAEDAARGDPGGDEVRDDQGKDDADDMKGDGDNDEDDGDKTDEDETETARNERADVGARLRDRIDRPLDDGRIGRGRVACRQGINCKRILSCKFFQC